MPIRNESEFVDFEGWTLRVRRSDAPAPRVLLLIHGRTGDETSMWVFVRNFSSDYSVVAPRAPYLATPSGFSWLPPASPQPQMLQISDVKPSAMALVELLDRYAGHNAVDASEFDVLGFSEGGVLASTLALTYPDRIRRIGILSAFIPLGADKVLRSQVMQGKPIFVAHGTQDKLVGIDRARQSVRALEQGGALVTFCEAEIGHKVSANCLRALETFFA